MAYALAIFFLIACHGEGTTFSRNLQEPEVQASPEHGMLGEIQSYFQDIHGIIEKLQTEIPAIKAENFKMMNDNRNMRVELERRNSGQPEALAALDREVSQLETQIKHMKGNEIAIKEKTQKDEERLRGQVKVLTDKMGDMNTEVASNYGQLKDKVDATVLKRELLARSKAHKQSIINSKRKELDLLPEALHKMNNKVEQIWQNITAITRRNRFMTMQNEQLEQKVDAVVKKLQAPPDSSPVPAPIYEAQQDPQFKQAQQA